MKIVMDGGHAANTAGKRSPDGTVREWNINAGIVDKIIVLLKEYENVSVLRVDDPTGKRDVPLSERTKKANNWGADAYVSIHQNAFGSAWNDADGVETYAHTSKAAGSVKLATNIQTEIINTMKANDRGVKFANFQVLRETQMDAVLVECGFMTDKDDAVNMKSATWQRSIAEAIVRGISKTYGLKKKVAAAAAATPRITKKPVVSPSKPGDAVHRVIVDGKQVGAYTSNESIGEQVTKALANNPRSIMIELV